LCGAAVSRADSDRACQRHSDRLEKPRRVRSRADPPGGPAARVVSVGLRPRFQRTAAAGAPADGLCHLFASPLVATLCLPREKPGAAPRGMAGLSATGI